MAPPTARAGQKSERRGELNAWRGNYVKFMVASVLCEVISMSAFVGGVYMLFAISENMRGVFFLVFIL